MKLFSDGIRMLIAGITEKLVRELENGKCLVPGRMDTTRKLLGRCLGDLVRTMEKSPEEIDSRRRFDRVLEMVRSEDMTAVDYFWPERDGSEELSRSVAHMPGLRRLASPVIIHSERGQGKTHYLSAIAYTSQNARFINTGCLMSEFDSLGTGSERMDLLGWLTETRLLLLDDIHISKSNVPFQDYLLRIAERMRLRGGAVIATATVTPDSFQRIRRRLLHEAGSGIQLLLPIPDTGVRKKVVTGVFKGAGYRPDEDVVDLLVERYPMNMRVLRAAASAIRLGMLHMPSGERYTPDMASGALESLKLSANESFRNEEPSKAMKYRNRISASISRENQLETLREAASERLREMEERGAPERELTRVRKALEYMENSDLKRALKVLE